MTQAWRHIDPATHGSIYSILGALVAPRPIAWVATVAPDGSDNIAPHSFYQLVSTAPPVVMVSSIGEKDTVRNVRACGEFTVCGAPATLMDVINETAVEFPHGVSEFDRVGLARIPGTAISTPRAAQAPYALECRLLEIHPVGNGLMILGEIVHIIVDESVFEGEHINSERLNLVSRLGASDWGHGGQLTSVPRISLAEFNARHQ
jgi:flavin reductase (DIM6/NTAB) family NADH-FMN oxidoreductase RutF